MHLKRLELFGFKSFADRTELEFKPGITAVVGPNGSGKSNISDAILWVLGEQNVRHLRGEGSQDVIFAGTDRRRPMGMAEVTLYLDNSSGTLPIDFSEVTITRRIYRSGESEFFINRTPCRLRDIYELFLDTGIGRDAYSIIGQNQIEAVLSARGEERRQLFEEAAGIKKYRHRRREAERKLEATRQNLTRVSDIIAELEAQIPPLAAQAEIAAKYNGLTARLRHLETLLLTAEIRRHREELHKLLSERASLQLQAEQLAAQLSLAAAEEQKLKTTITTLEKEADDLRAASEDAHRNLLKIEGELALVRQQQNSAIAERQRLQEELRRLENRLKSALDEEESLRQNIESISQELAKTEEAAARAGNFTAEQEAAVQKAQANLLQARRRTSEATEKRASLKQMVQASEARLKELEERSSAEQKKRRMLEAELAEAQARLESLRKSLLECQNSLKETQNELASTKALASEKQKELEEKLQREQELKQASLRRASRLKSLQEMHDSLEGVFRGVRAVLQAAKSGILEKSKYRLVADLLGVPEQYRTAIEVALGSHAQDIVTDTDANAQAAIEFLKSRNLGRATFLPLDLLRPDRIKPVRQPGVIGVAADLVYFPQEVQKAVDVLLGRILVVENLPTAVRLLRQGGISGARLVTLDGELVNPSGAITGGSREQTAGILSRKLEIDKLSRQVSEDAKALKLLEEEARRTREELNAIQNKLESLNEEVSKQSLTAVRIEDEARHIGSTIQKLQSQLSEITEQDSGGISQQKAILTQLQTELANAEKEYAAALQCETEAQDLVRAAQAKLDEAKAASANLQAQLAQCKERLAAAQLALARTSNSAEQIRAEISQKREELSGLNIISELKERMNELEQEAARLRTTASSAEEQLEAKHGQRSEAMQALSLLSLRIKEMEEKRSAVAEKLHRLEVREASLRSDLMHAETKLLEEYQMNPDDAVKSLPPPERGASSEAQRLRAEIASMGAVNLGAVEEYNRIRERIEFLNTQRRDLEDAEARLRKIIAEIDEATKETFYATYRRIEAAFETMFQRLFGGGRTQLVITDPDNLLETGIDIIVQPPGKKLQNIQLLSGGEKALTAVALLFALLEVKPSPFCLLDEVDAALDDANVERFAQVVKEFSARSQFIIITHNKTTMSAADTLCGVTMEEPGVSKVISIKLEDYVP